MFLVQDKICLKMHTTVYWLKITGIYCIWPIRTYDWDEPEMVDVKVVLACLTTWLFRKGVVKIDWAWLSETVKGALDKKYNIIPNFVQKSWDFLCY